ncbi:Phosphoglycerol transferase I [Citrobacter freundii]|uniref:Phosphoglycerol transferase I n=1 Tax=Citrobacter freundii TaxID=546 RepID=A0A7G2IMA4_CITFR|nr:Phosphoglycerol transferase I [Citrobacter freundii]
MLAWKPDIIRLWNFPKEMKEFTVDQDKNMISFSGSHFRLPLLLRVSDKTRRAAAGKRILGPAALPAG